MYQILLRRLLAAAVILITPIGLLSVTTTPASAGQVGVTIGIEGAGAVTVVEGTLEDGAGKTCTRYDNQDHRVTVWCGRVRNEEPFEAWVWLRPTASPEPAGEWVFWGWSGCDATRSAGTVTECAVKSEAFGSVEKSPVARFRDMDEPRVTSVRATQIVTSDRAFQFDFTVTGGTSTCRLEGQSEFVPCSSPVRLVVPEGKRVFQVRATDASGNVGTGQTEVISIDTVINAGPFSGNTTSPRFYLATGAGEQFMCSLDEAVFAPCGDGPTEVVVLDGVADGTHRFRAYARAGVWEDAIPAEWRWDLDTTAPSTTTLTPQVVAGNWASFTFNNPEASGFQCRLETPSGSGMWWTCASPLNLSDLEEGDHTLVVKAFDGSSNLESPGVSHTWTVDTIAPNATLAATTSADSATFSFHAVGANRFECRLSGPGRTPNWTGCTSPTSYSSLLAGDHLFEVRASDAAGNVGGIESHRWTATVPPQPQPQPQPPAPASDTSAPESTVAKGPSGYVLSSSASFSLTSEPGAEFRCTLDAVALPCGEALALTGVKAGTHTFAAAAVDAAGNVDATPAVRTWTVPLTAAELRKGQGWTRRTNTSSYGGRQLITTRRGARLTHRLVGAKQVALIFSTGRKYGTVKVYAGSRLLRTVRLASRKPKHGVLVKVAEFKAPYTGPLRVVAATSGRSIPIEGLGVATG